MRISSRTTTAAVANISVPSTVSKTLFASAPRPPEPPTSTLNPSGWSSTASRMSSTALFWSSSSGIPASDTPYITVAPSLESTARGCWPPLN